MTAGGADGWPIFVGAYGLLGAMFPTRRALVEALWTGELKPTDPEVAVEFLSRSQIYATEMLEPGVTGLGHDAAPARYLAGDVAFMPTGVWQAPALDEADLRVDLHPVPRQRQRRGQPVPVRQVRPGLGDRGQHAEQRSRRPIVAAFSEPDNYQAFVNAVGFIPTQPTASLDTKLGEEVAKYLENYRVGYEQYWVAAHRCWPVGRPQPGASWFKPFNEWEEVDALASRIERT
jgi:raffinose/stachyose/melibiose transport system substrate-binding protein